MNEINNLIDDSFGKITFWVIFFAIIITEFFLFRTYISREIIHFYPKYDDQASYLSACYDLYEQILSNGLHFDIIKQFFAGSTIAFVPETAIFFLIFGASRFTALFFAFCFFILLQIIITKTILFLTRNNHLVAIIFLGLLLSINVPFMDVGGITDYRIEFIAFCLYGIFVSCVIRAGIFSDMKWTIISALFASWLMLTRVITITYISQTIFFLLLYYSVILYLNRKQQKEEFLDVKKRLKNIGVFIGVVFIFTAPLLWIIRELIYNYYVVGHVNNEEPMIRLAVSGITSLFSNIMYYPYYVVTLHVGELTFIGALVLFIVLFVARYCNRIKKNVALPLCENIFSTKDTLIFLVLTIIIPLYTLVFDDVKIVPVASIVVVPLLWLIMLLFILFYPSNKTVNNGLRFLALFFILIGGLHWFINFGKHTSSYEQDSNPEIIKMYEDIGNYANEVGWSNITFTEDQMLDYISFNALKTSYYENQNKVLHGNSTHYIYAQNKQELIKNLRRSNVLVMNVDNNYSDSYLPYSQSMTRLHATFQKIAETEFALLGKYYFLGSQYNAYVRPDFLIVGLSGGWITKDGIEIEIPNVVVNAISGFTLKGQSNLEWLGSNLKVQASIKQNTRNILLPANITITRNNYQIDCSVPHMIHLTGKMLRIHLGFSNYFIPAKLGINTDTRELVLLAPTEKAMTLVK